MKLIFKKTLILILICAMLFSLLACGDLYRMSKSWDKASELYLLKNRVEYFYAHEDEFNQLVDLISIQFSSEEFGFITNNRNRIDNKNGNYTKLSGYYIYPQKPKSECKEIISLVKKLKLDRLSHLPVDDYRDVGYFKLYFGSDMSFSVGWICFETNESLETEIPEKKEDLGVEELINITGQWYTYKS